MSTEKTASLSALKEELACLLKTMDEVVVFEADDILKPGEGRQRFLKYIQSEVAPGETELDEKEVIKLLAELGLCNKMTGFNTLWKTDVDSDVLTFWLDILTKLKVIKDNKRILSSSNESLDDLDKFEKLLKWEPRLGFFSKEDAATGEQEPYFPTDLVPNLIAVPKPEELKPLAGLFSSNCAKLRFCAKQHNSVNMLPLESDIEAQNWEEVCDEVDKLTQLQSHLKEVPEHLEEVSACTYQLPEHDDMDKMVTKCATGLQKLCNLSAKDL